MSRRPDGPDPDPAVDAALGWLGPSETRRVGRIWATVELERALVDLGLDPGAASAAIVDPLLGARVVVVPAADRGPAIALAEPSTEGRLAATLARHGEGPAGAYHAMPIGLDAVRRLATAAGVRISPPESGPFGREVLVDLEPVPGWAILLVDPAAVPSRP